MILCLILCWKEMCTISDNLVIEHLAQFFYFHAAIISVLEASFVCRIEENGFLISEHFEWSCSTAFKLFNGGIQIHSNRRYSAPLHINSRQKACNYGNDSYFTLQRFREQAELVQTLTNYI